MIYNGRRHRDPVHTPEGVRDLYGTEYKEKQKTIDTIRHRIHLYGYEDLQTPSFEFFDVFSREIGTTPSRELYKFFDKEGNTLVLRPDFTPSVARCAAKYFMDDDRPLRFCYEGSAFSNTSNLQGKRKETTQMGAELIGEENVEADGEMVAMLIESLLSTGLEKFQISVGNVEYFKGICESLEMDEETELELREYISGKNYFAAEDLLKSSGYSRADRDLFLRIRDFMDTAGDLEAVEKAAPGERAGIAVQRLIDLWKVLEAYDLSEYVSFDLSLLSKYHYYTGIVFKGYTYGVGEPIASGGRYDQLLHYFGKKAPAIGWMIPIDPLLEAMHRQHIDVAVEPEPARIYYTKDTYGAALQKAQEARGEGKCVALLPKEKEN